MFTFLPETQYILFINMAMGDILVNIFLRHTFAKIIYILAKVII